MVEPDAHGYHAYCPALKGLHICGDTVGEALENAREAAELYIESLIKHGDSIPIGVQTTVPVSGDNNNKRKRCSSRCFNDDLMVVAP